MKRISFMVPGIPCAWARAGKHGKIHFTPKKQGSAMRSVSFSAFDAMGGAAPLTGPLRLTVNAVWPWPKSMTEKKRRVAGAHWRTSRPDADNIAKLVGDAMNGVVYADDAQIVSQTVTKQYGLSGATYVLVEEIADGEGNQP